MALTLTDAALNRVREKRETPNKWLRLGIRGGGCSGFMYAMDFVEEPQDKDRRFDFDDVKVCVDIKSYLFLTQTTLDFEATLMHTGFVFRNPDAAKTCSCGESFSPF
ncbi:MAG: iron-sulfur cluster assembly accessory protein [Proteobacteria bacterium]|nr:iron-sulfur cluster assembly accessory protein [Pseudomonadota bacterium]